MKRNGSPPQALGCALAAMLVAAATWASAQPPQQTRAPAPPEKLFVVGRRAPDLRLPSLADGKPMSLSNFTGGKVLLAVFASW